MLMLSKATGAPGDVAKLLLLFWMLFAIVGASAGVAAAEADKSTKGPTIVVGSLQLTVSSSAIMQDVEAQKGFKDRFSAVLGVEPEQVNMMFSLTSVVPRRLLADTEELGKERQRQEQKQGRKEDNQESAARSLSENAWLVLVRYRIQIREGQSPEKILAAARSAAPGKLVILSSLVYKISIAQSSGPRLTTVDEVEAGNDLEHVSPDFPEQAPPTSTRTATSTSTRTITSTSTLTTTTATARSVTSAAARPTPASPTTTITHVPTTTTLGGLFMADSSVKTVGLGSGGPSSPVAFEQQGLLRPGAAEQFGLLFAALALLAGCLASLCPRSGELEHSSNAASLMQAVGVGERRQSERWYHEGMSYR